MEPIDLEQEKKKNTKLAVVVGALGVAGFMVIYFIFMASMFLFPFAFLDLMPIPSL